MLNDMDADNVNSINDTEDSEQAAIILRDSYFDIIDRRDWARNAELVQLENSGTSARPTHIAIPDNVSELLRIFGSRRFGDG